MKWDDDEIEKRLAKDGYWEEGKVHVNIHSLYLDVRCPDECIDNEIGSFGFIYCEGKCPYFGEVSWKYDGSINKFGTDSKI